MTGFAPWLRSRLSGGTIVLSTIPGVDESDPLLQYADAQIRWYDANSRRSMRRHFVLRTCQLFFAAGVPITQIPAAAVGWRVAAGVLGGLIALCQGIDTLHHYGEHYVAWRFTCQRMIRERQLFAAEAPPYATNRDIKTLAKNLIAIEGEEQAHWQQTQQAEGGAEKGGG